MREDLQGDLTVDEQRNNVIDIMNSITGDTVERRNLKTIFILGSIRSRESTC